MPQPVVRFFLCCVTLFLVGCSHTLYNSESLKARYPDIAEEKRITTAPFIPQKAYQCGPAALAMALGFSGVEITADELVDRVYVPGRKGSFQVEMLAATRNEERLPVIVQPTLDSLLKWINAGQPVLIFQNLGLSWYPKWHYALVVGYDLNAGKIFLHSGETSYYPMTFSLFQHTWQRGENWGMVALKPGQIPYPENPVAYLSAAADFERQASAENRRLIWQAGVDAWPGSREIAMGFGNFLFGQMDFSRARDIFEKVVSQHPDFAPAYNNLAAALVELGKPEDAENFARQAVSLGGRHIEIYRQTLSEIEATLEKEDARKIPDG